MSARRTPRSLRVQVAAVLVAVLTIGMIVAGTTVTLVLRGALVSRLDETLTGFAENIADRPMPITPPPVAPTNRGPSMVSLATISANGIVTSVDATLAGAQLPEGGTIIAGEPFSFEATGGQWRGVLIPRTSSGDYALVAASLYDVNFTVDGLIRVQVIVGAIVVVIGGFLGFVLVTRRMRPLAHMTEVTDEIAAGNLERRVTDSPGSAEVAHLSTSFNSMVDALSEALDSSRLREEQMRRFVGDAGHELRTPLTSIRGFAELATSGQGDSTMALERIESESARMGILVDDLLTLARMDAERPVTDSQVDLAALLTERLAHFSTLHVDYPVSAEIPEMAVIVRGEQLRLAQIIDNLLTNITIHTPRGTAVEVELMVNDSSAILSVRDLGPGMAKEVADRVFERFYRGDDSRARTTGGTGLGLSIVDVLVRAHGGSISVETARGEGSTFFVELPIALKLD